MTPPAPPKSCSVEGCETRARARGWCAPHYQRWFRQQNPRIDVDGRTLRTSCLACGIWERREASSRLPIEPLIDHFAGQTRTLIAERLGLSRRHLLRLIGRGWIRDCCADRLLTAQGISVYDVWGMGGHMTDVRERLAEYLEEQARWRADLADRFPDDPRNRSCSDATIQLAAWVRALPADDEDLLFLDALDTSDDVATQPLMASGELASEIASRFRYSDPNQTERSWLRSFVAACASDREDELRTEDA